MFTVYFDLVFGKGEHLHGQGCKWNADTDYSDTLLTITVRFILGEMGFRKSNVLISQWHLFLSLF